MPEMIIEIPCLPYVDDNYRIGLRSDGRGDCEYYAANLRAFIQSNCPPEFYRALFGVRPGIVARIFSAIGNWCLYRSTNSSVYRKLDRQIDAIREYEKLKSKP